MPTTAQHRCPKLLRDMIRKGQGKRELLSEERERVREREGEKENVLSSIVHRRSG